MKIYSALLMWITLKSLLLTILLILSLASMFLNMCKTGHNHLQRLKGFLYQLAVCGRILKRENHDREKRAMARITRAAFHVSVEEVKERMSHDPHPLYRKRWLIIYNALIDPREAKDIARHTGVSVATVHKVISTYNRLGVAAVETPGKGGRRHEYMTWEEERELLTPFFELAKKGEITTIAHIKHVFEKRVGHEVEDRKSVV